MWHALRAELDYSRPFLLGGLALGVGVVIIVSVVFVAVGDEGPPVRVAAGLRAMFLIMAPMIVGFIAQTYRSEERRARLLLSGPITPRQIAGAMVLLPVVLLGIGVVAAALMVGLDSLFGGRFEIGRLNIAAFVGGQIFAYVQMGILAQEATAARSQQRSRATAAGWTVFVIAVLLLATLYLASARGSLGSTTWPVMILGHLMVAAIVMVASVQLYAGRTDFTR